jgi:Gas vesicle synthesis protein GvpL/GvpF
VSLLLLHAIGWTTSEAQALSAVGGLRGQALEAVQVSDLRAWATRWTAARDLTREDILAAHALVSGLGDVAPVRLPTWLEDEDALRAAVSSHRAQLAEALQRVSGRVEVGVTARWAQRGRVGSARANVDQAGAAGSGTRYLLERRRALQAEQARRARAAQLQSELLKRIGDSCVEAEHRACPSPHVALSSAFLVGREAAPRVVTDLSRFGQAEEDVRILVHGPWPPYTFARIPTIAP